MRKEHRLISERTYSKMLSQEGAANLSEKLVALRKDSGLTQKKAAEKLGITRSALKNYETGFRKPRYDTLCVIADFYGVTTDYLLGAEEYQQPEVSPNTQILLQTLKGATEEEIAQAIRIIEALKK